MWALLLEGQVERFQQFVRLLVGRSANGLPGGHADFRHVRRLHHDFTARGDSLEIAPGLDGKGLFDRTDDFGVEPGRNSQDRAQGEQAD